MNQVKVIKTGHEHEEAVARIEELLDADPAEGTAQADELELLALLVERYEEEHFPIDPPDPIDAIRFRMDQSNLSNKDLVPYLGSASKVSEVLSGRRSLSLNMIRKLCNGLGIPAEVLIRDPDRSEQTAYGVPYEKFPIAEMRKRGYFSGVEGSLKDLREHCGEKVSEYLASVPEGKRLEPALPRRSAHVRSDERTMDPFALWAWQVRVLQKAYGQRLANPYGQGTVTEDWLRRLAQLSWSDQGPGLALQYLERAGIHFVVEHHLQKTYLDGAACRTRDGAPVVALTLRYDRVDNFWFTLLHELAHVALHFDGGSDWFLDDLDARDASCIEREADKMASDALIPADIWADHRLKSAEDVRLLARDLGISPTIVAGRARHESGNHRLYGRLFRDRIDREALGWEQ